MEELVTGAVEETAPAAQKWYEGVSLEDAEIYIQANLKSAARSVIAIGYYLKCVHRNELFKEAGYKDICEYAKDRFGFSASTTSRYMTRNDKFSVNGNSPILDDKYKDFNKSQLQEMLSLDAEQLEKVTPDMTVVQIREMKKPKEIPYIAIPGQIELTDLPGVEPEDVAAAAQARKEMVAGSPERQAYTISAEDLLPQDEPDSGKETIAISQQDSGPEVIHFTAGDRTIDGAYGATIAAVVRKYLDSGYARPEKECEVAALGLTYKVLKRQDITVFYTDTGRTVFDVENARLEEEYQYWNRNKGQPEPSGESQTGPEPPRPEQTHPEKSGKCIHRPEFDCTLEEAHKLTPGTGENCSQACCWDCVRRGDCKLECYSSERRPEMAPEEHSRESAAEVQQEEPGSPSLEECILDFYQNHMSRQCAQAVKDGDAKVLIQELISNHGEPHDSGATGYGFYQCGPERIHFQDNMCETFLSLTWGKYVKELLSLIGSAEDEASEHGNGVPDMSETEDTVIDGEFTEILKMKEDIVNPPPKPEQPELPALKNNEQRAAFVDAYETWPLWIETKQTGERYYRYDLEDGTSMVVKVYHARIFDGYASGSYEAQYHDGYGRHEYYLLRDGKFFRDCETNRGLLIEKLKEIQKVKKG